MGYNFSHRFPQIVAVLTVLPVRYCLIDGEAVVCNERGLAVFDLICGYRHATAAVLCAFDPRTRWQGLAAHADRRAQAHPDEGPAHRRQHRQAAGAAARAAADKRGVTRLQPHISRQSTQVRLDPNSGSIAATHYLTSWATSKLMRCNKVGAVSRLRGQAFSSSSNAFASFRSSVSKPSVNQP